VTRRFVILSIWATGLALSGAGCDCQESGLKTLSGHLKYDPMQLDFGQVVVGDLRIDGLDVQDTGEIALDFTSFAIATSTDAFSLPNGPLLQLVPAEMEKIAVQFTPQRVGKVSGTLQMVLGKNTAPVTVTLTGEGIRAGARVTPQGDACAMMPGSLSFGQVTPGQSVDRSISIEATGSAPLKLISASMESGSSPAFSVDPIPQGTRIAPGSSFGVTAHYHPDTGGADTGAIVVVTDSPDDPMIRVPVCGQGVAPAVCATPVPLDLGAVAPGSTKTGVLHVTSCGLMSLDVQTIALANDAMHMSAPELTLTMPPTLPATLAPGSGVDVTVTFSPTTIGARSGFIEVDSTASGNTRAFFPVRAVGAMPCDLQVLPAQLTWSGVAMGQTSAKNVLITNSGALDCSVTRLQIVAGAQAFTMMNAPAVPLSVPSGGSVMLSVVYSPQGGAPDTGRLEAEENGNVHAVTLVGDAPPPSGCQLELMPTVLNFGVVATGSSRTLTVDLHNLSGDFCLLHGATIDPASSPGFSETPGFTIIAPHLDAMVSVTYAPPSSGMAQGVLHLATSDVVTPNVDVPLYATSAQAHICVVPQLLPFGSIALGSWSTQSFTISACGGQSINVTALDWTTPTPPFSLVNPPALPFALAAGASQSVVVKYQPTTGGLNDRAVVTVRSDDSVAPAIDVVTTGTGFAPAQAPVYLNTADSLYSYDPASNTATLIGAFSNIMNQMTDIAIDAVGHLYGVSGDGVVWSVDPMTARAAMLFTVPGTPVGLTCLHDGTLVIAGDRVSLVNPVTGMVTRDLVPAGMFNTSGDVIALPDGQLYWSINPGSDRIMRIDPTTGALTSLAMIGANNVFGLGYANGTFLGFANQGLSLVLDPSSGAMTANQPLSGAWNGATTNPVRW
jgi:hypothetical protein